MRDQINAYGNSKLITTLYLQTVAKENTSIYFASVSPGGVKTTVYSEAAQPLKCMANNCFWMFECMMAAHSVNKAAKRYVDVLLVEELATKFPSGSVLGAPSCCPYLGAAGPLTNQQGTCGGWRFKDAALQAEAAKVMRSYVNASSSTAAPVAQGMERSAGDVQVAQVVPKADGAV